MKLLIVLIFPLLTGCAYLGKIVTVPLPEFPPVSKELLEKKCPDLEMAPPSELFSDLLRTVVTNYGEYHKCRAMVEAWQEWYVIQKLNYEKLRNEQK
jgi:hypothetical protein